MNQLEQNISARQEAEAVLDLIGEQSARFWELLRDAAISKLPEVKSDKPEPMNEAEAARFDGYILQFGKYADNEIGQTPTEYLAWLADGDEFTRKVQRYVRSERFKRRQTRGE